MTPTTRSATPEPTVLVATDNADDAGVMKRQLEADFKQVRVSTQADRSVQDFSEHRPDVLVLAFDTLEKSQLYYLGLYRAGGILHPHKTIILCGKDQVREAFALCKKEYFDDYVLYWPHSHDGPRLLMSVWSAWRKLGAMQPVVPSPADLLAHARHLSDIESIVAAPVAPTATAGDLARQLQPALAGTRALVKAVGAIRPRVLVVDDDAFARKITQHALDPARWDVALASDGLDALAQLRRMRPDLILVDVQMPGMSGIELTARLKASAEFAEIPVVMMTGNALRETLSGSIEAGAVSFIVKPVSAAALTEKLDKILSR